MDANLLIVLGISVFTIGLIIGLIYIKKTRPITEQQIAKWLPTIITGSGLFFNFIDELDLKNEPEIKKIGKVIDDTLKFIEANLTTIDDETVISYIEGACITFNLQVNESQMNIIKKLVSIGINELKARTDSVKM